MLSRSPFWRVYFISLVQGQKEVLFFVFLCPPHFSRGCVSLLLSGAETKRKTALTAFNKLTNKNSCWCWDHLWGWTRRRLYFWQMFSCSRVHGHIYFSQSKHSECFLGCHVHSSSVERALGLACWLSGKASTCSCRRRRFSHWVRKILWRMKWRSALALLPGKSCGQRNPAGCSPYRSKLDTT